MFVDTKVRPQGEQVDAIAPSKMKLSDAIRIGARMSDATVDIGVKAWATWQGNKCFSCVIGAAWIGLNGKDKTKFFREENILRSVLAKTGASIDTYEQAQYRYEHGGQSREQVADWLEAQGL